MKQCVSVSRMLFVLFITVLATAGSAGTSHAAKISSRLQHSLLIAGPGEQIPVIVTMQDQADTSAFASQTRGMARNQARTELIRTLRSKSDSSQQPLKTFLQKRGIRNFQQLWIINGLAFKADTTLITELAQRSDVAIITQDIVLHAPVILPAATPAAAQWNIQAIHATDLWNLGYTGQGIVVATLDTGVDQLHPDLTNWRRGTNSWFDPYGQHATPYDASGHGTAVMGVLAGGETDMQIGGIGVAPDSQWIAAKIFNDADNSNGSYVILSFQWLLDPDNNPLTDDAPDVVNLSWGFEKNPDECINDFASAINNLKTAGIAVIASAGNAGPNPSTSVSPANNSDGIAVGAVDQHAAVAFFSGRGPTPCSADPIYPRLVAPGVNITSADLTFNGVNPVPYLIADGTSFSAPHVAGVMTLLMGAFPLKTVAELEMALEQSADDLGILGPDNNYGYGLVNALAAFRRLNGEPHLSVYDPKPPANDLKINFGSVPVDSFLTYQVVIRNNGGGNLDMTGNNFSGQLATPFAVIEDTCSNGNITLLPDEACQFTLQFQPGSAGNFNDSLIIQSNDPDAALTTITLAGSGNSSPTLPQIVLSSAGQAIDNNTFDFGSVPPGKSRSKTLTISNSGVEILSISQIDAGSLASPFVMVQDDCSGHHLAINDSCDLILSFAPNARQSYQSLITVFSNDPDENPLTVTVTGTGNNLPIPAVLLSPTNGAIGLPTTVTFLWHPGTDPDGGPVTEVVKYTEAAGPATSLAAHLDSYMHGGPPFYVACLLLLCCFLLAMGRKTLAAKLCGALAGGLLLLNACGGGGDITPMQPANGSYTLTGLQPATTYYWIVETTDSQGGISHSAVWKFTTK